MIVEQLLAKASSYHIFNYLFPGTIFAVLSPKISSIDLSVSELFAAPFVYYFYGLTISRIGSLIVEPLSLRLGIVKYANYGDLVSAEKTDPKISTLIETSNTFRTVVSMLICVMALIFIDYLSSICNELSDWIAVTTIICLVILFLISWRKQNNFINRRCIDGKVSSEE